MFRNLTHIRQFVTKRYLDTKVAKRRLATRREAEEIQNLTWSIQQETGYKALLCKPLTL